MDNKTPDYATTDRGWLMVWELMVERAKADWLKRTTDDRGQRTEDSGQTSEGKQENPAHFA